MPETPQLYGLLIAIDDYPAPVPPLGGCVNDIRKVKTYLETEQREMQPQLLVLENEQATKSAILDGFRQHLAQAGPSDTVLVYFSGHGTQEEANPEIWPFEPDGKLECIVNYDGILESGDGYSYKLLADKELRYLLHELAQTQAHILTIFDCCHSGGNTRINNKPDKEIRVQSRRYVASRLTEACPEREWEQFIFSGSVDKKELASKPLSEVIPVGQHVQMGACRGDQLAYEINGGGIFTSTLLSLLEQTKGAITYFDLRSRIRYMIKNEYKQTPQVYVQGQEGQQLFSGFLGKTVNRQQNEGNLVYNSQEGWVLDLGAIHGLTPDLQSVQVQDGASPFTARVQSVKMSYTRLLIQDPEVMTRLDPSRTYRVLVPGALAQPIRVFLSSKEEQSSGRLLLAKELTEIKDRLLLVEREEDADYVVRIGPDSLIVTLPFVPDRPIVRPVSGTPERTPNLVVYYLQNIAKWTFVRDLHNPNVHLFEKFPIDIQFYLIRADRSQVPLELNGEEIVLPYRKMPDGSWENAIRIKVTNRHKSRLYCSLIYLSETFQIYSSLFGEPLIFLEPGESAWAFEGGDVEMDLPEHIVDFNWPNSFTWLKFMVSTQEFDPAVFDQDPLPTPNEGETRGIKLVTPVKMNATDWTTRLVQIRMPNPEFKEG